MTLDDLLRVYDGSDGAVTRALYAQLEPLGPAGVVAVNLFRAQKCSDRAKVYRGRGFSQEAYRRKQWSMDNLCTALTAHGVTLGFPWGWHEDPTQAFHRWVLYVDLPTGQVSFHTDHRGVGPEYASAWDGVRAAAPGRILRWIAGLNLHQEPAVSL